MKYTTYTFETISQAGYSILNDQINTYQDKVLANLKDKNGNVIPAYLKPSDYGQIELPSKPIPFPKNWFIIKATPEATNPKDNGKSEHFFLTISTAIKHPKSSLPFTIGASIHLKSIDGVYKVLYANRDIIVITCKPWAKDYNLGLRDTPTEIIFWDDFKCKQGQPEDTKS